MRNEKGITLVSLVLYATIMMIVIGIVAAIQANTDRNLENIQSAKGYVPEFNKLSMYMATETQNLDNGVKKIAGDGSAIEFKDGNKFVFADNGLYKISADNRSVKVCNNVANGSFEYSIENRKEIVKVTMQVGENSKVTQTMEYVINSGTVDTKNIAANTEEVFACNKPDVSKLNPSNFSYVTWVDNTGKNSNIAAPTFTSGTSVAPQGWYDYDTGQWANIKTFNGDIEAYWVWIPRFAYQVPASGGAGNEAEIKVKFIKGNGTQLADGSGNAVYATSIATNGLTANLDANYKTNGSDPKWIVHPAFSFGDSTTDYSANTQLSGIWFAKFEASSSNPTATNGGGDVTNLKVLSKPGVLSWRGITLKNIWTNVQAMTASGGAVVANSGLATSANTATIPTSFIDIHPAKNMEWSAVSILSQSTYGVYNNKSSTGYSSGTNMATTYEGNTGTGDLQVWNNSRSYYTGYAASTKDGANESQNASYAYNTVNGIKASATGTVYGIYDMAGCAWEYVMGIYNGIATVNSSYRPSLTASYYRYYDNYATTSRTTSGKIGDLTYETANTDNGRDNWNSDWAIFVNSSYPVFQRGGWHNTSYPNAAGVFAFYYEYGGVYKDYSFRPIMISV